MLKKCLSEAKYHYMANMRSAFGDCTLSMQQMMILDNKN